MSGGETKNGKFVKSEYAMLTHDGRKQEPSSSFLDLKSNVGRHGIHPPISTNVPPDSNKAGKSGHLSTIGGRVG